jgi:hypothetical protein
MVSRRLYTKVDVELPQNRDMAWTTGGYLMFRPHVVQSIRELSLRNGLMDFKNTAYNRRERSDAGSVDGYVRQVLEHIPQDQLMSLE